MVARGWSGYLAELFNLPAAWFGEEGSVVNVGAIAIVLLLGVVAIVGIRESARVTNLLVLVKVAICVFVIVAVLYIGVSLVVVGMVPYTEIDRGAPIAAAFESVGAGWAAILVSIAAVAGLTSVILVQLVAMGRIGFAVARDGLIPPAVAKVHPRWGTPYRITAMMTVLVALLAGFLPLAALADMVSIGALCAFVLVSLAVPILRRTRPELERPFTVPFSPVLPIVSALACLYLMLNLSVETWLRFLAWMLLGFLIYLFYGRRRNRLAQP
ncbi:amino acid permease [Micromonospora sp. NPDC050187]|uniref:amino acid permease n=1 Tax=Micromonospora sp. NPDC050187 TaxID=3364277 RepID=UPI0037902568